MSRFYDEPIVVTLAADGTPTRLVWRGTTYRVRQVFARWHLRDRWWAASSGASASTASGEQNRPSDRFYYRLCCTPSLICDVYRDAAGDGWRLEYLHD